MAVPILFSWMNPNADASPSSGSRYAGAQAGLARGSAREASGGAGAKERWSKIVQNGTNNGIVMGLSWRI